LPARICAANSFWILLSSTADPLLPADGVIRYAPAKLPRPMIWFVPGRPPNAMMFVLYSTSQSTYALLSTP